MKRVFYFVAFLMMTIGCKKLYDPHIASPATRYLVAEGFINSEAGVSTITLSRTTKLLDSVSVVYEHHAQVSIEGSNNESFPLTEGPNGSYTSDTLYLNPNSKYRVRIITQGGKEYISDFSSLKYTPPIDSISWQMENGGVRIYANTHDDLNTTKFYRWTYSETWEFHSRYLKTLFYVIDPITHQAIDIVGGGGADTTIYKCWKTQNSTNIILGSSEKLTADKIYLPIRYIEPQADELTVLYYIHLKQYAVSHDAYLFYQKLKKNTEQLGSIFDAMPSGLSGNIHCVNDPDEIVIGYVEPSQEREKEIFIHNTDLPITWISQLPCGEFEVENKPPLDTSLYPTRIGTFGPFNSVATFYVSDRICVDCTSRGTNKRPLFWP